jgi:hypothetical protein
MAARSTVQIAITAILLAAAQTLPAQNSAPPPPCPADTKSTPQKPCTPAAPSPSAAEQFPFPGESQAPPASTTSAPDAPAPSKPSPSPNDDKFPFPGEKGSSSSSPAASPNPNSDKFPFPGENRSSSGSSSSSSSSSSSDPDHPSADKPADPPPLKDAGSYGINTRRKLPKVQDPQTPDERFEEDLKVARFYRDKGNFNAAYLRSKDAVKTIPDDPEAHLLLAQMAQRLNKKDEAVTEYNAALKFDPTDDQKKAASKALSELK